MTTTKECIEWVDEVLKVAVVSPRQTENLTAIRAKLQAAEGMSEAFQNLIDMCENCDWSNGVTDPTGTIDEGRVMSWRHIDKQKEALAAWRKTDE